MRAVLYVRVSTEEQAIEGYSISAQTSILREFAKAYEYDVIKVYQDAGISGKNISGRPALKELLSDARSKKFDIVLIWKLSRLSRSLLDLLEMVDIFNQNGISFQSFSEKFDTSTPIGKMLLQLLGSIAEFERNTIAENVKMGLNERFKQGNSKGSIPFGYKYNENKQAIIVPEQAEIIKKIFQRYVESRDGNCILEITRELNATGYKTRKNKQWNRTTIKDMLCNPFYAGYVRTGYHSHGWVLNNDASIIKGNHEPIIDEKTFNKISQIIKNSKRMNFTKNENNVAVFSQLLICPLCGGKMYAYSYMGNNYTNKKGELKQYLVCSYRCSNTNSGNNLCKGFQVSYKKIDDIIIDNINSYVNKKLYMTAAKRLKIKKVNTDDVLTLEQEIKRLKSLKEKYFVAFEQSNTEDLSPYIAKINQLHVQIQNLEKELSNVKLNDKFTEVNKLESLFSQISDFKTMFYNISLKSQKEIVRKIVTNIYLTKDKKIKSIKLTNSDVINSYT
ncbi:site-specific DNA recombinase [Ruminiclostridium sufflavum DSM 19573]|uniref:Site-specific DNA recombinase n=1 Tax=Ruminiclostridium sufflavum DSM 19573 TaxID=1121337 RepID=A0A318XNH3_9FIRM|nr:recombinase family protein [Ruminiclostridium sufflavum]PYG88461.1 site-specific DNA recombinase [Ruminiclostridium sufflavum DSM 19573]